MVVLRQDHQLVGVGQTIPCRVLGKCTLLLASKGDRLNCPLRPRSTRSGTPRRR